MNDKAKNKEKVCRGGDDHVALAKVKRESSGESGGVGEARSVSSQKRTKGLAPHGQRQRTAARVVSTCARACQACQQCAGLAHDAALVRHGSAQACRRTYKPLADGRTLARRIPVRMQQERTTPQRGLPHSEQNQITNHKREKNQITKNKETKPITNHKETNPTTKN